MFFITLRYKCWKSIFMFVLPFLAPPSGVGLPELHRPLVPITLFGLFNAAQTREIKVPLFHRFPQGNPFFLRRKFLFRLSYIALVPCYRFAKRFLTELIFNIKCCPTASRYACHLLLKINSVFFNTANRRTARN